MKLKKTFIVMLSLLLLQSCGQTFEECIQEGIKNSHTDLAMRAAALLCAREHPESFKKK